MIDRSDIINKAINDCYIEMYKWAQPSINLEEYINNPELIKESDNGIYNFGSGYSAPLKDFIGEMKDITKSDSELRYGAINYPSTGIVNVNPDVRKLVGIGWRNRTSFRLGIRKIICNSEM